MWWTKTPSFKFAIIVLMGIRKREKIKQRIPFFRPFSSQVMIKFKASKTNFNINKNFRFIYFELWCIDELGRDHFLEDYYYYLDHLASEFISCLLACFFYVLVFLFSLLWTNQLLPTSFLDIVDIIITVYHIVTQWFLFSLLKINHGKTKVHVVRPPSVAVCYRILASSLILSGLSSVLLFH